MRTGIQKVVTKVRGFGRALWATQATQMRLAFCNPLYLATMARMKLVLIASRKGLEAYVGIAQLNWSCKVVMRAQRRLPRLLAPRHPRARRQQPPRQKPQRLARPRFTTIVQLTTSSNHAPPCALVIKTRAFTTCLIADTCLLASLAEFVAVSLLTRVSQLWRCALKAIQIRCSGRFGVRQNAHATSRFLYRRDIKRHTGALKDGLVYQLCSAAGKRRDLRQDVAQCC